MACLDSARSSPPDASTPITRRRLPSRTWTPAPWRRQARPAANLKTCAVPGRAVPASGRGLGTDPRIPGEAGQLAWPLWASREVHVPSSAAWVTELCLSGAQSAGRRAFPWSLSRTARPRAGNTAVPSRTRSRGHQEAAAPAASGNPGASSAQAAFAASPQEHSLKPALARWPRPPGTGQGIRPGSPVCHPGPPAGQPSVPASVTGALAGPAPGVRDTRQPPPPLQLAVGEDADLTARAGDAHDPGHRGAGAGRERPGSPARRPVLISTARPLASWQLARDRPVTSRLAATGSNPGRCSRGRDGCDACAARILD